MKESLLLAGSLGLIDAHMQLAIQRAALLHHQQRGLHLALDLAGAGDFEPAAALILPLKSPEIVISSAERSASTCAPPSTKIYWRDSIDPRALPWMRTPRSER